MVRTPPSGDILQCLLVRNLFANGGHLLLRSDAVHAAGGFTPGIAYGEDWEFWIRIALQGPFAVVRGRAPVLFVRQHPNGAYHRLAADPAAFVPCMDAIFTNAALVARFGQKRLSHDLPAHRGRKPLDHRPRTDPPRQRRDGRAWLRRSVRANATAKRLALLAAAHVLPLLPRSLRGPFRSYRRQQPR